MSEQTSGVVTRISSKPMGSRGGTVYSFQLADGDWYRTGWKDSGVEEGDSITFNYDEDQYGLQVDINSIKKGEKVAQNTPVDKAVTANKKKGNSRDSYWEDKAVDDKIRQNIISYQAAWTQANVLVATALSNGLLETKGADNKKFGNLFTYVEGVAMDIFEKYLHGDDAAKDLLRTGDADTVDESAAGQRANDTVKGGSSLDD